MTSRLRSPFVRSRLGLAVLVLASLFPSLAAAETPWVELERLLDRLEAGGTPGESAAAIAPRATGRAALGARAVATAAATDLPLVERVARAHAARLAEFDRMATRPLPPKARGRLEAARAAYEAGQGRLLRLLREVTGAGQPADEARAGLVEAREILRRLADAERRQPLSGDLKMRAPQLRPKALAQGVTFTPAAPALQAADAPRAPAAATIGVIPTLLRQAAAGFESPLAAYAWVKDGIGPEFYHGFMKGPEATFLEGAGNDADTASLLVALLRAKGVPTRYARGTVTVPADRLRAVTGTASIEQAVRVLERGGVPHEALSGAGGVTAVKMARVWAEAYLPYVNYRGAPLDAQGKAWVPLDPGFKELAPPSGVDVVKWLPLDPDALADEYLAALQTKTPLELARQRVTEQLAAQGKTYEFALNHRSMLVENLGILPNTLPYAVEGRPEVSYETPVELRHTVRFHGERGGVTLLDETLPVADLLGKRLTLSYVPADPEDAEVIASFGGLAGTPPYLVEVKPVLKSGGITLAAGDGVVGLGVRFDLQIDLVHPGGTETILNPVLAGNLTAFGLGGRAGGDRETGADHAAALLSRAATSYLDRWNRSDAELADLLRVAPVRPTVSGCMVMSDFEVEYAGGDPLYPVSFEWKGVAIDADLRSSAPVGLEGPETERNFLLFSGLEGSVLEGRVLEDIFGVESVSTVEALQLAAAQGIEVLDLNRDNVDDELPGLPLDPVVKEEVREGALRGLVVRLPSANVTRLAWTGVGYRILDPVTGEAAFQLHGGHSGGVTAPSVIDWPSLLVDTLIDQGEEPAPEGTEVANISKFDSTDFQEGYVNEPLERAFKVLVTSDDGQRVAGAPVTFAILGGGGSFLDPISGAPAGSQITVKANARGEAEARLMLGKDTDEIPRFACLEPTPCSNETETYATQVGLNLVTVHSGAAQLAEPFFAYGVPDDRFQGDPNERAAYLYFAQGLGHVGVYNLRVITLLGIDVLDQYANPISNFDIRFAFEGPPILGTPAPGWVVARPATNSPGKLLKLRDYIKCSAQSVVVRWGECAGEEEVQIVPSSTRGAFVYPIAGDSPYSGYNFKIGTPKTPDVGTIHYGTWGTLCRPSCGEWALRPRTFPEVHGRPVLVSTYGDLIEAYPPGQSAEVSFSSDAVYEGHYLVEVEDDEGNVHYLARGDNTWTRKPIDDSTFDLSPLSPGTQVSGGASPVGNGVYEGSMTMGSTPQLNEISYDFKLFPLEIPYDPEDPRYVDNNFVDTVNLKAIPQKFFDRPWVGQGEFSLWGVSAAVASVKPNPVRIAGNKAAETSLVQPRILPPDYPQLLFPSDVRFDLRRSGEEVLSANGVDGSPFEIPKGLPFPPGDYTGHMTIEGVSKDGADIVSEPFPIQACAHLELLTPVVALPVSDQPGSPAACNVQDRIRFRLCEASRIVIKVAGEFVALSVDGGPEGPVDGIELEPGEHFVRVPRELAGEQPVPFSVLALSVQEPLAVSRETGVILNSPDLVTLEKEVISLDMILDPVNQTLCVPEQKDIVFALCDAAKVTVKLDGRVLNALLDGVARAIDGITLDRGVHRVVLNVAELALDLKRVKPFSVAAESLADPDLRDEKGGIVAANVTNRAVLPVGRTFVKGVDLFDGHMVQQETDIDLPGRHLGLQSVRTYSSSGHGLEGEVGAGWDWNYAATLIPYGECGLVSVKTADGSSQVFRRTATGFTPQKGYHGRLVQNGLASYDYFDKANHKHRFVFAGPEPGAVGRYRLDYVLEPHGDRIQLKYDGQGRVEEVAEVQGGTTIRRLEVTYVRAKGLERLKTVEAFDRAGSLGVKVTYEYDDEGNLKKATRSGTNVGGPSARDRVHEYSYTVGDLRDRHQMVEARDPNGHITRYDYYLKTDLFPGQETGFLVIMEKEEFVKRVIEFPRGAQSTRFSYDFTDALATLRWQTTVVDPRGTSTRYVLNGNGSPLEIHEAEGTPEGRTTTLKWASTDIFKEEERDGENRLTTYGYDANGNLTLETVHTGDPLLGVVTTSYEYHPVFNKLTRKTDRESRTTHYTIHNANGDLLDVLDPVGNKTHYDYDESTGLLLKMTDPRGYETEYSAHDSYGNPQLVEDALGNQTIRQYDRRGRLVLETDTWKRRKEVRYDGLDRPVLVSREAGFESDDEVTATSYYPGGQVESQTNPNQAQTFYTLDGLNRVTRADTFFGNQHLVSEMEYDGNGNKTLEADRRGVRRRLTYDRLNRLTRVAIDQGPAPGPTGEIANYGYDKVGNKRFETDLAGQRTDFEYDGLYNLKLKRLPEGPGGSGRYEERYRNDRVGNQRSSIDANGHETTFEYDGLSRVTKTVRDPVGLNLVSTVTYADPEPTGSKVNKAEEFDGQRRLRTLYDEYDPLNRERKRRARLEGEDGDPATGVLQHVTETTYVDARHEMTIKNPRGFLTVVRMDGLDRIATQTVDPGGLNLVTESTYDGLGNRRRVVDPRGNDTLYQFDGLGRMVFMSDAERKVARYEYDGEGLRTTETDRRRVRKDMAYDNMGRLLSTTLVPSLSQVPWSQVTEYRDRDRKRIETDARGFKTTIDLDRIGRVVTVTDPDGFPKEMGYDGVNKVRESDKRGNFTTYAYDAANRLRRTTDPAPFSTQTVELTYDDANNRVVELDRRDITKVSQFDSLGRLRSVTRSGVVLERHEYDGNGNRTVTRDAENRVTRFDYDAANRTSAEVEAPGTPVEGTTTFRYDQNGNVLEERDPRAASLGAPWSLKRTYDRLNRLETETDGEGNEHLYDYDPEGNRTSVREPMGQVTLYDYDELGKLTGVTQPGNRLTAYRYDQARNRTKQTDAKGNVVEMTYDRMNRLAALTQDPGGLSLVTGHLYDPDGRERLLTDPKNQQVTSVYEELGRLKSKSYAFAAGDSERPWRHTTLVTYLFDENNNLRRTEDHVASGSDPPGPPLVTTRTWDTLDRLETETNPLPDGGVRTVEFTYYANGLRKTVKDPANQVTEYVYDARNRLKTATIGSGSPTPATTSYTYLPDSLRHEVLYPNGVKATHGYDRADRLTRLTNLRGPATISAYGYEYDRNGNRLSQIETNGGAPETTTYAYDELNRLATVTYPNSRKITYGYDPVGNRTSEVTTDSGTAAELNRKTASFDKANRLERVEDSEPGKSIDFEWDKNGNQTAKTEGGTRTLYRYDVRDKLAEVWPDGAPVARVVFQYDCEGRLIKKIGDEGVRQYVHDQTSRLLEYDGAGLQVAKYEWSSDRLISLFRHDEPRRFYSFDALASVTALTDTSGAPVARYHLDTWGNLRFPTELNTSKNRFAFTGHLWDQETELYFAKARYLDPKVGRFISQDSFLGQIDQPPSLHRYLYVNANPTKYTDPDGHMPQVLAGAIAGGLIGFGYSTVRQTIAIAEGAQPGWSWEHFFTAGATGAGLGALATLNPVMAGQVGLMLSTQGVAQGIGEWEKGHPWTGGFDIVTSALGGWASGKAITSGRPSVVSEAPKAEQTAATPAVNDTVPGLSQGPFEVPAGQSRTSTTLPDGVAPSATSTTAPGGVTLRAVSNESGVTIGLSTTVGQTRLSLGVQVRPEAGVSVGVRVTAPPPAQAPRSGIGLKEPGGLRQAAVETHNLASDAIRKQMSTVTLAEVRLADGTVEVWATGSSGRLSAVQKQLLAERGVTRFVGGKFHGEQNIGAALPEGATVQRWGISWAEKQKAIPCPSCAPMVEHIGGTVER